MEVASRVFVLGNSNAIRIPRLVMDSLSLHANDPVTMEVRDNEIIIKKKEENKAYPSISELFEGCTGTYQPREIEAKGIVGRELI